MRLSDYISQASGFVGEAPIDGLEYARKNAAWTVISGGGGGIPEAPQDSDAYARLNASWTHVYTAVQSDAKYAPSGFYLTDAPANGSAYGRLNNAWSVVLTQTTGDARYALTGHTHSNYLTDAPSDGNPYARQDAGWVIVSGGGSGDFLTANLADNKTAGDLIMNNGIALALGTSSNVRMYSNGSNAYFDMSAVSNLYIRNGSSTQFTFARSTGNFTASGNVTAYSDFRLKKNVEPIHDPLDKIALINGVTYTDKATGDRRTGVIAQEVLKVMPEAVLTDENGYHSVAYGNLVGLLIEAIKDLEERIAKLEVVDATT